MATVITDGTKLNNGMTATANKIREKTGNSDPIAWDYSGETGFADAIDAIQTGGDPQTAEIYLDANGVYYPPAGLDGFSKVVVQVNTGQFSPRCDQVTTFDWGEEQKHMAWNEGTPEPEPTPPSPPTPGLAQWSTGTDNEVAALIDAARAGTVDLQQDAGWQIGDKRTVSLSAFTGGNSVTNPAESVQLVITSFDEYMESGNVLQFDFAVCLSTPFNMANTWDTENNVYGGTEMYTTTLPALVNALPAWLKDRLVTFSVQASVAGSGTPAERPVTTLSGNKLALRSLRELTGDVYAPQHEGEQLDYYKTRANIRKNIGLTNTNAYYWTRTPSSTWAFMWAGLYVDNGGPISGKGRNRYDTYYVAPFGCL